MRAKGWLLLSVLLMSLVPTWAAAEAQTVEATLVLYNEQEPGTDTYPVRILVTPEYIRFDDGHNDSDYVLYERLPQRISSVVHDRKLISHFAVPKQMTLISVKSPAIDKVIEDDPEAPKINNLPVKLLTINADGETCLSSAVVPGLMPDVVEALAEYHAIIKKRNIQELNNTPADLRTPCYLANQIFAHGSQYDFGFPVHENIKDGRKRILMDYRSQVVGSELFWLPDNYQEMTIE